MGREFAFPLLRRSQGQGTGPTGFRRAQERFLAFGWDPSTIPDPESQATFERSKLNWNELSKPTHAEMLDWYRQLIQLRRTIPSLNNGEPGNTEVAYSEEQRWLRVMRGRIVIAISLAPSAVLVPLEHKASLSLSSRPNVVVGSGGIILPSDSIAVLQIPEH